MERPNRWNARNVKLWSHSCLFLLLRAFIIVSNCCKRAQDRRVWDDLTRKWMIKLKSQNLTVSFCYYVKINNSKFGFIFVIEKLLLLLNGCVWSVPPGRNENTSVNPLFHLNIQNLIKRISQFNKRKESFRLSPLSPKSKHVDCENDPPPPPSLQ